MIASMRDARIGYEEGNEGEGRCKLSLYPLRSITYHPLGDSILGKTEDLSLSCFASQNETLPLLRPARNI